MFTHLEKLYYPKDKITKAEVLQYYEKIAHTILPFLKDRPQVLQRYPEGIEEDKFFQKDVKEHPSWVKTVFHHDIHYLLIQDLNTLLYVVNLGCIELHPFFSRYQKIDYPDFFVFDLDPEDISFQKVIETAQVLHEVLEKYKIPSVCKTSGATGLHICVPSGAKYTYDQVKEFSEIIAIEVHRKIPKITSLERLPKNRQKKVYIDCLQNNRGQTIASAYSLRAFKGAPVSAPLDWSEVAQGLNPKDFNINTMEERIKEKGDLFKPILGKGISLEKILKKFTF